MNIDWKDLTLDKSINITFIVFGLLIPSYWFIFQFNHKLFIETELIKLILLCLAIDLPLLAINTIGVFLHKENKEHPEHEATDKEEEEKVYLSLVGGSALTGLVLYIPCFLSFFFFISQNTACIISGIIEAVVILLYVYLGIIHDPWPQYPNRARV